MNPIVAESALRIHLRRLNVRGAVGQQARSLVCQTLRAIGSQQFPDQPPPAMDWHELPPDSAAFIGNHPRCHVK